MLCVVMIGSCDLQMTAFYMVSLNESKVKRKHNSDQSCGECSVVWCSVMWCGIVL